MALPADDPYVRPSATTDDTVKAVGLLTEALEKVERARGALYDFHQLIGSADTHLDEAADALDAAGHAEMAQLVRKDLIGRNVIDGRWTFQIVDEFDDTYYGLFRQVEANVRNRLVDGKRHIYEAELKDQRRTKGHAHHESRP